jgi:hypothetical protein
VAKKIKNSEDSRKKLSYESRKLEIEKLLDLYFSIGKKMKDLIPMLSEILIMSMDLSNKIRYETSFRYRLKSTLMTRMLSVTNMQIKKITDYINIIELNKNNITSEFLGEESVFE